MDNFQDSLRESDSTALVDDEEESPVDQFIASEKSLPTNRLPSLTLTDSNELPKQFALGESTVGLSKALVEQPAGPSNETLRKAITSLGSPLFRTRLEAQQELLKSGISAIPHLSLALSHSDPEIRNRAGLLIPEILNKIPTLEILSYRDKETQTAFLAQKLERNPTRQEQMRFGSLIADQITPRLAGPRAEVACADFIRGQERGKYGNHVTDEVLQSLVALDSSPGGRPELTAALGEIFTLSASPHLRPEDFIVLAERISGIALLMNPEQVHRARIQASVLHGQYTRELQNPQQISEYALNTYKACRTDEMRAHVLQFLVCKYGLDCDQNFMQIFIARGGNQQMIQQMRKAFGRKG